MTVREIMERTGSKNPTLTIAWIKDAINLIQYPKNDQSIDILGPVEAQIFLLRGKYRYRILLKGRNRNKLNKFTQKMLNFTFKPPTLKVIVDVDPYSFT